MCWALNHQNTLEMAQGHISLSVVLFIPTADVHLRSGEQVSGTLRLFDILHRERANKVFGKRPHVTARDLVVEPCCFDIIDPAVSTSSSLLLPARVI
jgi:hypothetical protein